MHLSLISLAAALSTLVATAPTSVTTTAPTCTPAARSYSGDLNDSAGASFQLRVNGGNASAPYNLHNVQLRPSGSSYLGVVDSTSPVLTLNLTAGSLYTQIPCCGGRDDFENNGLVGGLRNISTAAEDMSSIQELVFRNLTGAGKSFKKSQGGFYMLGGGNYPLYNLYSEVTEGYGSGFQICPEGSGDAAYWQLYYYSYYGTPPSAGNCDNVAVQATIAPYILD